MACSVPKDSADQKKACEDAKVCIEKGYDKPLSSNIWDAFGGSIKETTGIATAAAVLGIYFFR